MIQPNGELVNLLQQVRADFDRARFESGPIEVMLLHRATNAEAEGVVGHPRPRGRVVAFGGAGHRDGGLRVDKDGHAIFRPDPIVDVNGNPIVNSAGDAFDLVMPAFRTVEFTGDVNDYQRLKHLAERAGRLVSKLKGIPSLELLAGWQFSNPDDLWWALVFETAWADRHPLVTAKRQIWAPSETPSTFYPYDVDALRHLAKLPLDMGKLIPEGWLKRLPDAFVSDLDNVAAASFDTIDLLLREVKFGSTNSGGSVAATPSALTPLRPHMVKILFIAANPLQIAACDPKTHQPIFHKPLDLDKEFREIQCKVRGSENQDVVQLVAPRLAARADDLLQSFNEERPQIVHFSGHGTDNDELVFLAEDGSDHFVSKKAVESLFRIMKDQIRIVVLNACFSNAQAAAIAKHVDCAIGMKRGIGDKAAITFAASFYRAIGFGRSVQEAFDQGIVALQLANIDEDKTPTLMVRKGVDPAKVKVVG